MEGGTIMAKVQYYGTGRRKKSVARCRLVPGNGNITINERSIDDYFGLETLKVICKQPLVLTDTLGKFNAIITVKAADLPVRQAQSVMVLQEPC
jgi:small subunit ribosomal protein S9